MWGLIKKDLLIIKGNVKTILILILAFGMMELQGTGGSLTMILPIMGAMLFLSTFSYDNYNKWDAYACTLPNGRKNVVKSKYIATFILVAFVMILTLVISWGMSLLPKEVSADKIYTFEEDISGLLGSLAAVAIIVSVMYPLIFKFGVENGRIALFIVVGVITAVAGVVVSYIQNLENVEGIMLTFEKYAIVIIPIILAGILFGSYKISEKIYSKKEF